MKAQQAFWFAFKAEMRKYWLARKAISLARRAVSVARKEISLAFLMIESIPSVARDLVPIRVLRSPFLRKNIGHLAVEQDIFIKNQLLSGGRRRRGVIVMASGKAANECLLEYWSRYIWVIRSPFWAWIVARLDRLLDLQFDVSRYTVAINETAPYVAVLREWGSRPALLALSKAHEREGRARLADCQL